MRDRDEQMKSTLHQLTFIDAVQGQGCVAGTWLRHGKGLGETILIKDYGLGLKGELKERSFLLAIEGPRD